MGTRIWRGALGFVAGIGMWWFLESAAMAHPYHQLFHFWDEYSLSALASFGCVIIFWEFLCKKKP